MGLFAPKRHATIHVEFYDFSAKKVFAEAHMPIERLPESFEARTTMHIGSEDWQVIEARPMTAAEFSRTGKLLLVMNKVTTVQIDPSEILYSLATITGDALPPVVVGSSKLGADVIEIHEDDWRQIEWIAAPAVDTIATEMEAIRRIHAEERQGQGFRTLHLREAIPSPLADRRVRLDEFRTAIGRTSTWLAGLSYQGVAGIVADSFAVRLISSVEIFGVAPNGIVQRICFANTRMNNVPMPDVQNLASFAAAHDLLLVDWCGLTVLGPDDGEYAEYFDPKND